MADKNPKKRGRDKMSESSQSRSRSGHKRLKTNDPKLKTDKAEMKHDQRTKKERNEEIIASYEPSADIKQELEALLRNDHREYMNKKQEAHNKISSILNSMTPKQEQRFECWNRSAIPKHIVKSIMNNALNKNNSSTTKKKSNVDDKSVIVMQALSKCLVMELVSKSREIQKETIQSYIQSQRRKQEKQNRTEHENDSETKESNDHNQTLSYPPLVVFGSDEDEEQSSNAITDKNNAISMKDDPNEDIGSDGLIGLDVSNENGQSDEDSHDRDNAIDEQYVMGAIRPVHLREALRRLQADKSSFFHARTRLLGTL